MFMHSDSGTIASLLSETSSTSSRASSLTDGGIRQQREVLHIDWLKELKPVVIITNQEQAVAWQAVPQGSMSCPFLEFFIDEERCPRAAVLLRSSG
jgi:hypothetical protein